MLYEYDVSVPANTAKGAPVLTRVTLTRGRVVGLSVQFPPGCVGLVHTALSNALHQIAPANQDGDIKANAALVDWPDDVDIPNDRYELQITSWNLDDTYAHTITWRFHVLTAVELKQQQGALSALLYLDKWFSSQGGVQQGSG